MENKKAKTVRIAQGFNANPQVYLNQERGSITHRLGSDLKIEMPINLYDLAPISRTRSFVV